MDQYEIVYTSTAVKDMTSAELDELLRQSRNYNAAHSISGCLIYGDRQFLQLIEGPEIAVKALYAKICKDPRHTHPSVTWEGPTDVASFSGWRMLYALHQGERLKVFSGVSDLPVDLLIPARPTASPSVGRDVFDLIRKSIIEE